MSKPPSSQTLNLNISRPIIEKQNKYNHLTGVPGFEPGNGGTKTRCLTTWRHPIGLTLAYVSSYCPKSVK